MTNQWQKLQDENIELIFIVYYLNDCSMFFLRYVYLTNYIVSLYERGW